MRKNRIIIRLLLVGLVIGVLSGYVLYDRYKYKDTGIEEAEDVREHFDVLNASEVKSERVSDKYLFDVKDFLEQKGNQSILDLIKFTAASEFGENKVYVSRRPIYFWNAARSNVDTARIEIAFFNKTLSKMCVCYVLFDDKSEVLDAEGRLYEHFVVIKTHRQQKFISISVSGPGVASEEMLLNEESSIATSNSGQGPNSFEVTVEGKYYSQISHVKDLAFSLSDLLQKENLFEISI